MTKLEDLTVVLNGTNIFLKGTNISFLKFTCGILNRGVANSFWNHVIQISSRQMYFQDINSNLWKVKLFSGNIYSFKSNTYFWGTVMFVQDGFLYLIQINSVCSTVLWMRVQRPARHSRKPLFTRAIQPFSVYCWRATTWWKTLNFSCKVELPGILRSPQ